LRTTRTLWCILGGSALAVPLVLTAIPLAAPVAHANPDALDEMDYGTKHGQAICQTLDKVPTVNSVTGVIQGVMQDSGFNAHKTAQTIGFAVVNYCPKYQPLLTQWASSDN
jgi:hypothetical protein